MTGDLCIDNQHESMFQSWIILRVPAISWSRCYPSNQLPESHQVNTSWIKSPAMSLSTCFHEGSVHMLGQQDWVSFAFWWPRLPQRDSFPDAIHNFLLIWNWHFHSCQHRESTLCSRIWFLEDHSDTRDHTRFWGNRLCLQCDHPLMISKLSHNNTEWNWMQKRAVNET